MGHALIMIQGQILSKIDLELSKQRDSEGLDKIYWKRRQKLTFFSS